jgi:hypothetical protein
VHCHGWQTPTNRFRCRQEGPWPVTVQTIRYTSTCTLHQFVDTYESSSVPFAFPTLYFILSRRSELWQPLKAPLSDQSGGALDMLQVCSSFRPRFGTRLVDRLWVLSWVALMTHYSVTLVNGNLIQVMKLRNSESTNSESAFWCKFQVVIVPDT